MTDAVPPPAQKPVWPLFLVAWLSFIPFLGIFFGGAGATWGLVSSRRRALMAAGIAMTGALLNFAGIMVLAIHGSGKTDTALDVKFTQREMLKVVVAIDDYHAKQHSYPPTLRLLQQRAMLSGKIVPVTDMSASGFRLPREYRYVVAPDGESYDLVATGPDNVVGTADDIRPVLPDSMQAHSGFRPQVAGAHP
jgi:hypothetical protein